MTYTNASHLGQKHNEWLNVLDFYKIDLEILKGRLTEVAGKNTSEDARVGAEHFENQFIVQQNTIDELTHTINEQAHFAFEDVQQHAGKVETSLVAEQKNIQEEIDQFEKTVKELRQEFNLYLSKWM